MISSPKLLTIVGLVVLAVSCQIPKTIASPLGDLEINYKISLKPEETNVQARKGRDNKKLAMLDKINVDTYLRNTKAVNMQIKCVLKNGPCDTVGKEIKRMMPMVMSDRTLCDDCSQTQTKKIRKIIDHLRDNYPQEWSEGTKQYGEPVGL